MHACLYINVTNVKDYIASVVLTHHFPGAIHRYYESRRRLHNDSKPSCRSTVLLNKKKSQKKAFQKRVSLCTCIIKSNYHILLVLFSIHFILNSYLRDEWSSLRKPRKATNGGKSMSITWQKWVRWWWNHKVSQVALAFCRYTQIFTQGQHVAIVPLSRLICPFGRIKYPYWEAGQMSRKIWQKWLVSKEKSTGSSWFQHTATWQCSLMGYRLEPQSEQYTYQF